MRRACGGCHTRRISESTFLFADLAGFSAMTEVHGDEMAADAVRDFCHGVGALLPEFEAEQVKSIGDAVMVRVPDAAPAIELAVRLIGEVGSRHGSLGVRVGAHTGPAGNGTATGSERPSTSRRAWRPWRTAARC